MKTLTEVTSLLDDLRAKEGDAAVAAWIEANAAEMPEDVREQVLFQYSVDAFLAEAKDEALIEAIVEKGTAAMDVLESQKREIEDELKRREITDRLNGNASA